MRREDYFMTLALEQAKIAYRENEVPVGAVLVRSDAPIGESPIAAGYNKTRMNADVSAHAELIALSGACKTLGDFRLNGYELYVTLEPCAMCAGAIINARLDRVVFGAYDKTAGAVWSKVCLFDFELNHKPAFLGGVLSVDCGKLLSDLFSGMRK